MSIKEYRTYKDGKYIQTLKGTQPRRELDKLRKHGILIKKIKYENDKTRK